MKVSKLFSTQHACVCSSELTAADSITQLLPTALTSTRLIDMQRAEGGGTREAWARVEEEEGETERGVC